MITLKSLYIAFVRFRKLKKEDMDGTKYPVIKNISCFKYFLDCRKYLLEANRRKKWSKEQWLKEYNLV